MNSEWYAHLQHSGARIADETVLDFGAFAEETAAADAEVLADLSHFGIIAVSGEDALTFLQGQLTNDLAQVDSGHSQLSAWCNPKGRMLALLRVFRRDDAYHLLLPRPLLEPVIKRLRMFVLRSKVTVEDRSDALAGFGVSGPQAEKLLAEQLDSVPAEVDAVVDSGPLTVLRLPGPHPRFVVYGPPTTLIPLWEALSAAGARPVGAGVWALLDIRAGQPQIHAETGEAFVPQMVNLELIGGVNFKKGCYTGQEVVARMHYLGRPSRRMFLARVEAGTPPPPGTEIVAAEGGQTVGKVVDAQLAPDGAVELLAVLQLTAIEAGGLSLDDAQGTRLSLAELPYPLERE